MELTFLQKKLSELIQKIEYIQSLYALCTKKDSHKIESALVDFLDTVDIPEIKTLLTPISVRFYRQCILSAVRGSVQKLRKSVKRIRHSSVTHSAKEVEYALLWMRQALKVADTIRFFQTIASEDVSHFNLSSDQLMNGDVVLSYKTSYYLKQKLLSRLVAIASNSPVTHAMVVSREENEAPQLLVSGDATRGLGLVDPVASEGEMLIVMRLTDSRYKPALSKIIDTWRERAVHRHESPLRYEQLQWKFAELKCQVASLIGFCYVISLKLCGRPFVLANPIKSSSRVFCSELVDIIFKQAGLLLAPRSEHDALIGPIEILYSPVLSVVGVIARPDDLAHAKSEIRSQFFAGK